MSNENMLHNIPRLLTEAEATEFLRVSPKSLQAWRYRGVEPRYRKLHGAVRSRGPNRLCQWLGGEPMTSRPPLYPRVWQRNAGSIPASVLPTSIITETEAAQLCGVSQRTLARHRQAGTGPEQLPPRSHFGNAIRYVAWRVIAWRNRAIGRGPADLQAIGSGWLAEIDSCALLRPDPVARPPGTAVGTELRELKRRVCCDIRLRIVSLDCSVAQARWNTITTIN